MSEPAKVLIIDDSAVARQTLKNILSEDPELEVVGTAPDALIALKKISELNLTDYSYNPKKMKINETITNTLENNIHSISLILSLCV